MRSSTNLQSDFQLFADGSCDVGVDDLSRRLVDVPQLEFQSCDITRQDELNEMDAFGPTVNHQPVGVDGVVNRERDRTLRCGS